MNGSQIIVEALRRHGVDYLFGYPGGACMPIFDALVDAPEIKIVLVRHEQGEPTWQTDMPEPQANPGWYWSLPDQGRRTRSQACSPLKWTPYRWSS